MTTRLAIVVSHPIQYYSPWFRWLRTRTNLTFRVFYLWDFGIRARNDPQFAQSFTWDVDLLTGYEHEFVPNVARDAGTHHFRGLDNPTLRSRLAAFRPDAILLFGYGWKSNLEVVWWARRWRIPLLLRGDSHLLGREQPSWWRRRLLGILFRQFAGFLTVGRANEDFYRYFGVPPMRLFFAPHAVEHERFNPCDPSIQTAAATLRFRLGLDGRRILLFAGKFIPKKQPIPLLETFVSVATERDALVFVGDGPDKSRLQSLAARHPRATVCFLPFANQSEMPAIYSLGDVFVLPSKDAHETWGLAVNEAMHLGRPCLVSNQVGCQRDLVLPGETGWVFAADDSNGLLAAVRTVLAAEEEEIFRLGARARERIATYTYKETTAGLDAALAALKASG